MKIDHIALWVDDLEAMRRFYLTYFPVTCGDLYVNPAKQYTSYFLTFDEAGARIELMHRPDIHTAATPRGLTSGWAHISLTLGSREAVNTLTERLRADGYTIVGEPRTSGDGYYESVVFDPEGNYIELLA